jgi:Domain of unknown function (DUF4439)
MTDADALQPALAAEHAAVYVFGALAARATGSLADALGTAYAEHRARRDELTGLIRNGGEEPVAAAPAYRLPQPLTTVPQVRRAAVRAETAAAEQYAAVVVTTTDDDRSWAISALTACAVRIVALGGAPAAFPGAAELG